MHCVDANQVPNGEVCEMGAQGVQVQWLLASAEGAPNFALRRFTLEPGGQTPTHSHPWEHEVYVLRGDELHCFRAGEEGLQMLCLVPLGPATAGH
jgi:quercetin dioxygenase-like cupin family protein